MLANYLCPVLGYLGEFLHSKAQIVGTEKIYFKRKIVVMFRSLLILLDEIPSPGQLIMPALTLAINLSFLALLRFDQSNSKVSAREKISQNYEMDLYR